MYQYMKFIYFTLIATSMFHRFGTACERRVIAWLKKRFGDAVSTTAIMDLGCGNGHFTAQLLESGFTRLGALDYSPAAIQLAKEFIGPEAAGKIAIYAADILETEGLPEADKYEVIVDKGTFDAISLSGLDVNNQIAPAFKRTLKKLSKKQTGSLFVITSCNWTAAELKVIFGPELTVIDEIEHASFTFGGRKGQDVSTVIFQINH